MNFKKVLKIAGIVGGASAGLFFAFSLGRGIAKYKEKEECELKQRKKVEKALYRLFTSYIEKGAPDEYVCIKRKEENNPESDYVAIYNSEDFRKEITLTSQDKEDLLELVIDLLAKESSKEEDFEGLFVDGKGSEKRIEDRRLSYYLKNIV